MNSMTPLRVPHSTLRRTSGRVSTRLLLLAGLMACLGLGWTAAEMSYVAEFEITYPDSLSDDNVVGGIGYACVLCHAPVVENVHPFNSYGWDLKAKIDGGMSVSSAMAAIESMNSDGDPGGASNLAEINAGTQPGWTDGPNNTIHFPNGSTETGLLPPYVILGDFDPVDPWADLGNSLAGVNGLANLTGSGDLVVANPVTISLTNAAPTALAFLIMGTSRIDAPFKGGVVVPSVTVNVGLSTDPEGDILLIAPWPLGAPSNFTFYFQYWWADPGGPQGFAASNAISGTTP